MAHKLELKEAIKTFVFAPAVAGLSGFVTYLIISALATFPGNFFYGNAYASDYGIFVSVVVFAIIVVDRLDKFLIPE